MLTKDILEARQGVNVGFFYLREVGKTGERKVQICVKDGVKRVWDGKLWRAYTEFEPCPLVDYAIKKCEAFNGKIS